MSDEVGWSSSSPSETGLRWRRSGSKAVSCAPNKSRTTSRCGERVKEEKGPPPLHLHQAEGVRLGPGGSNIATCRGTRDLIVRRRSTDRGAPAVSGSPRDNRPHSVECPPPPRSTRALCGSCRRSESERVRTGFPTGLSGDSISKTGET